MGSRSVLGGIVRRLSSTKGSSGGPPAPRTEGLARAAGPGGIPGRWIRVVPKPADVEPTVDREVSDPTEALAVRAGWQLVDAYERLSVLGARQVFGREVDAWRAYTEETIVDLRSPDGLGPAHQSLNNRLRFRRMMDFARPGDRVFDVGFGRGFLGAQLIKGRGVVSYHGIDIVDTYMADAQALFATNGLDDAAMTLEKGDLYDLTREKIEAAGADLVICCEVLEHVPDAELALRTLADALPDGADLIFTVPLIGRLEGVWGHVSVFGVARLKQMLDAAGLHAHHVEPLSNVWALVVANRDPGLSQRVRDATHRPPTRVEVPLTRSFDFLDVSSADYAVSPDGVEPAGLDLEDGVTVATRFAASGGVRFPVPGLESLRLAFDFAEVEGLESVTVVARSGPTETCRWEWVVAQPPEGEVAVKVRPGETDSRFVSSRHDKVDRTDHVDVAFTLRDGGSVAVRIAASVLP
ncbi:class I SAM-dependent methyltransferase [Aeromicrobium sp. NPDC092404]|uniref:class I SAM-dependent methyltransferase n=1 Tax=Aeromicrobium sp. NPDC092404 TaxID=3154976 RepID=UPI00342D8384